MHSLRFLSPVAVVALVALAGCATPAASSGQSSSGRSTGQPSTAPRVVVATMADNGLTKTLRTGERLVVRLDSTYWTFASAAPQLRLSDSPVVATSSPCRSGTGCGSVTATYSAIGTGRFTVAADRTSCGEAVRCTGAGSTYRLTVVVS
jgi:hypothetical protein